MPSVLEDRVREVTGSEYVNEMTRGIADIAGEIELGDTVPPKISNVHIEHIGVDDSV